MATARACETCHPDAARTYRETGMARSFRKLEPEATRADFTAKNEFHHAASARSYRMFNRGGKAYMRRWQAGETNVVEMRIDYVLGSGNKAQTFLHRNDAGELIQLPVGWYSEKGGFWAMSPSYDRPDHEDFRRRIRYDCFFCHNAYPAVRNDSFYADAIYQEQLPEGIDCQRCHGPAEAHAQAPAATNIVNPARLSRDASMEVCMQCHLQSTSRAFPYAVQRLDRGVFSYRAGEPLANYVNHFDRAGGGDHFEIAHAAYRLRQAPCFTKSTTLTCVTCHSPHRRIALETACRSCHPSLPAAHPQKPDCATCHMPKRRTEDVVHAVMTDHRIRRRPPAGALAPMKESIEKPYRGVVASYYPAQPDALLHAVAQVRAGANVTPATLANLQKLAATPEALYELGEAYWQAGDAISAARWHEEALRRSPDFLPSLRSLGMELSATGSLARGAELLERARKLTPNDPRTLHDLGLNYARQGKRDLAIATLRQAIAADPGAAESQNALGAELAQSGDFAGAEIAFREALRARPDYTLARDNLEKLRR